VLVTVAAGLLLAGCGSTGPSGSTSASASVSASVSATAPSPPAPAPTSDPADSASSGSSSTAPEVAAFCTEGTRVFSQLNEAFDAAGNGGPTALPPLVDRTVAAFDQVQPPAAIAADWQSVQTGLAGFRQQLAATDLAAPDAGARVQAAIDQLQTGVGGPFQRITDYTDANCPKPSATPTS
jgi:hypothetical protein